MAPFGRLKSNPDLGFGYDRFLRLKKIGYTLVDVVEAINHVRYKTQGLKMTNIQYLKSAFD